MIEQTQSNFGFWLATVLGIAAGLAGGLLVAGYTGDFLAPPVLGASLGGAFSNAFAA
ncbi:MAG TPA: hypothetical protein VI454_12240 [Verrucomicrobiae bacterium]|jgi:purine-cytosine permease-like protein